MIQKLVGIGENIYIYRFIIVILVLILLSISIFVFKTHKCLRIANKALIVFFVILFVLLTLQVEVGSPISKPKVSKAQIEQLVSVIESNPDKLAQVLTDSETRYILEHENAALSIWRKYGDVYWSEVDYLNKRYYYHYDGYSKRVDYPSELKKNGYFEVSNNSGVRVVCFPTFYLSVFKFFSIYIPLRPGNYREIVVIENGKDLYEIMCMADTRYSLSLNNYIDIVNAEFAQVD